LTLARSLPWIAGVRLLEPSRLSAILVRVEDVRDETQRTVIDEWRLQDWRSRACIRCDNTFKRAPAAFVVAFAAIGAVAEVCGVCNKCRHLKDDIILRAGLAYLQRLSPAAIKDTAQ
jgi:hypothetical protein